MKGVTLCELANLVFKQIVVRTSLLPASRFFLLEWQPLRL